MNIHNVNIVIVRYKENLNWLNHWIPPYPNIYVYNKSLDDEYVGITTHTRQLLGDSLRVINIENIGHEGATYIYHVLLYSNLTSSIRNLGHHLNKITVFLQGDPFPHFNSPAYSGRPSKLHQVTPENFQNRLYEELFKYRHSKVAIPLLTPRHKEHWDEFPGMNLKLHFYDLFMPQADAAPEPATTETYEFSPGCQYIVPENIFYGRSLNFYKHIALCLYHGRNIKINKIFTESEYVYGQIDGWTMERIFSFIWDLDYKENPGAAASVAQYNIQKILSLIS